MTPRTHHSWRRLGLTAVTLLLTAGCAVPAGQPESRTPQARQQLLESWRSRTDAPAAVAGVSEAGGTVWVGASGTAKRGTGAAVQPTAAFRIASITKVFVAVVVLQLVEEGVLGLDDPVSTHLPDPLVALYDKVRAGHGGVGAAALVRRQCQGCRLQLNAGDVAELAKAPADEVLRCPECDRILVRTAESGL